jgi:hypothetical protein
MHKTTPQKSTTKTQKCPKKVQTTAKRSVSKHKRFETIVDSIRYTVPKNRIKQSKNHSVKDYRELDGSQADMPVPISAEMYRDVLKQRRADVEQKYAEHLAAGGEPRKYGMRKGFLYDRNRRIIEKAAAILVIQPGSDPEFYEIMGKLGDSWKTSHFRNGLVHLNDKPYSQLKEFFKGPVRVLLQNDPTKVLPSYKKLLKVLKDHPNTFFLGGAIDGFAGVAKDFEELKQFESKDHVTQTLIHTLGVVNQLIPAVEYPTKSFAQLANHHEKELEKQAV